MKAKRVKIGIKPYRVRRNSRIDPMSVSEFLGNYFTRYRRIF